MVLEHPEQPPAHQRGQHETVVQHGAPYKQDQQHYARLHRTYTYINHFLFL